MRLVVVDAHAQTYRVYEGRQFLFAIKAPDEPAWPEQVEEIRLMPNEEEIA